MSALDLDTLLALRGHLQVAHHVPGRIRLRIAPTLVKSAWRMDRSQIEHALRSIQGIRGVRINPAAGAVIVEYAPGQIAPETWNLLLHGDAETARNRIEALLGLPQTPSSGSPTQTELSRSADKETT